MDWEKRIQTANSDEDELEKLILEFRPFIISTTQKFYGKTTFSDDDFAVANIAFAEAAKAYTPSKGSFITFAALVIKRRLVDKARREKKQDKILYIADYSEVNVPQRQAMNEYFLKEEQDQRKMEIQQLEAELKQFDISFKELLSATPRQMRTRKACMKIVNELADDEDLMEHMMEKKTLPISQLMPIVNVPRKIFENHRRYIIAATVIISGDYPHIREYIPLHLGY